MEIEDDVPLPCTMSFAVSRVMFKIYLYIYDGDLIVDNRGPFASEELALEAGIKTGYRNRAL